MNYDNNYTYINSVRRPGATKLQHSPTLQHLALATQSYRHQYLATKSIIRGCHYQQAMVSINVLINPVKCTGADLHDARARGPTLLMTGALPMVYSWRGPNGMRVRVDGQIRRPARPTTRRWQQIARRRASQRWAALLQRIGGECHGMQAHLGPVAWAAFKRHAKQGYQPRFVSRFVPAGPDPALECAAGLTPLTCGAMKSRCQFRARYRLLFL